MAAITTMDRVRVKWYGKGTGKPGIRDKAFLAVLDKVLDHPRAAADLLTIVAKLDQYLAGSEQIDDNHAIKGLDAAIAALSDDKSPVNNTGE